MKRTFITAIALAALAATAFGAVEATTQQTHSVCIPAAVIHALS